MPDGFGTYTLTKLKAATGIADDDLSAHAPTGQGTGEVTHTDFMTSRVGMPRTDQVDGWQGNVELVSAPACLDPNTLFTVRLYADVTLGAYPGASDASYYAEQVMQRSANLTVTAPNVALQSKSIGHTTVSNPSREVDYVDFEFQVTGYGSSDIQITPDEPMNHDADNMGTTLRLATVDIDGNAVSQVAGDNTLDLATDTPTWEELIVTIDSVNQSGSYDWSATTTLHDPNDKVAESDREYTLRVNGADHNTQSPPNGDQATWSGVSLPQSNGTDFIRYEIELNDQSGTTFDDSLIIDVLVGQMSSGDVGQAIFDVCSETYTTNANAQLVSA